MLDEEVGFFAGARLYHPSRGIDDSSVRPERALLCELLLETLRTVLPSHPNDLPTLLQLCPRQKRVILQGTAV